MRPIRRTWLLLAVVPLLLCGAWVVIVLFFTPSFNQLTVAAGLPTPDRAYQTGTIYGYDVFIWDCYQGKRIVVYRYSSEMTTGAFMREETACGQTTPIEDKLANEEKTGRDPKRFW